VDSTSENETAVLLGKIREIQKPAVIARTAIIMRGNFEVWGTLSELVGVGLVDKFGISISKLKFNNLV